MRHHVLMRLDLLQPPLQRHQHDDAFARLEAIEAVDAGQQARQFVVGRLQTLEKSEVAFQRNIGFRVQDIDLTCALGFVATAHLEIIKVVRRRYLDGARAFFRIGIFIGDNRDEPPDQREPNSSADEMSIARIVRVNRDRAIAEHRFRTRGGDGQDFAGLLAALVHDGIVEIIEMPVRVLRQRLRSAVSSSGAPSPRDHLNVPLHSTCTTSRSEIAVWNVGSQLTRRLAL